MTRETRTRLAMGIALALLAFYWLYIGFVPPGGAAPRDVPPTPAPSDDAPKHPIVVLYWLDMGRLPLGVAPNKLRIMWGYSQNYDRLDVYRHGASIVADPDWIDRYPQPEMGLQPGAPLPAGGTGHVGLPPYDVRYIPNPGVWYEARFSNSKSGKVDSVYVQVPPLFVARAAFPLTVASTPAQSIDTPPAP